jgi:hypothetical protein
MSKYLFLAFLFTALAPAQTDTGSINGVVSDKTGGMSRPQ